MPTRPFPARRPRTAGHAAVPALALIAALAACRSGIDPDRQRDGACPQTYEFGNDGCARLVVLLDASGVEVPAAHRLDVRARALPTTAAPGPGAIYTDPLGRAWDARLDGPSVLGVTFWGPVPAGDTVPAWVVARLLDDTVIRVGVPLPVVGIDSARYTFRRTPVGEVPTVDTLRLTLRRP